MIVFFFSIELNLTVNTRISKYLDVRNKELRQTIRKKKVSRGRVERPISRLQIALCFQITVWRLKPTWLPRGSLRVERFPSQLGVPWVPRVNKPIDPV